MTSIYTKPMAPHADVVVRKKSWVRSFVESLGPGLVTGAADDDPSGILTYSQSGAQFGLSQLWTAIFMLPLMIAVQEMSARIALVTGQGIAAVIKQNYSKQMLYGMVSLLLVANTINLGADLGAMADSARLILRLPSYFYVFLFGLVSISLEVFVPYKRYAPLLKLLTILLFAYFFTGLIATKDWSVVFRATFVPHMRFDFQFLMIIVGVLGTTISPYCFFLAGFAGSRGKTRSGEQFCQHLYACVYGSGCVADALELPLYLIQCLFLTKTKPARSSPRLVICVTSRG